jgi:hypothetical protein
MANEWEELYKAAIIETDGSKLEERIEAAEFAMHARLHEFPSITAARLKGRKTELSRRR